MQAVTEIKKLCTPAFVYLVIAVFGLIVVMLQNVGNTNKLCVGQVECSGTNTPLAFLVNAMWIIFWTWVLSTLCKYGHPNVAWFLVLLPFVVAFIALVAVADMASGSHQAMHELEAVRQANGSITQQQQQDSANMNLRVQQGYFESGAHSGVKVYQI